MEAIKTENLVKKYGDRVAVDNLNISIEQGELFGLLGVNGAGKTTTIKILTCLSKATSGKAYVLGKEVSGEEQDIIKSEIGVSTQETAIAENLTVKENLVFIAQIYGADKILAEQKAEEAIKTFSMEEYSSSMAKTLSGGWQRRLSIAMAIITEPKLLFLDEPTLGLDVLARRELWKIIRELKNKQKTTIILTTHYLEEAEHLSDRIGIMVKGKLVALGTVNELKKLAGKEDFEEAFVKLAGGDYED